MCQKNFLIKHNLWDNLLNTVYRVLVQHPGKVLTSYEILGLVSNTPVIQALKQLLQQYYGSAWNGFTTPASHVGVAAAALARDPKNNVKHITKVCPVLHKTEDAFRYN